MSDGLGKMSDGLRMLSDGLRNLSDGLGKVSDGLVQSMKLEINKCDKISMKDMSTFMWI